MQVEVTKKATIDDLQNVMGGEFPAHHPQSFFESRLNDDMAFIAKTDEQPVGFLLYSILWGNTPLIELIKVKPEFQRNGIGKSLMAAAVQDIKNRIPYEVIISSSETANDMGNLFHKHMGFEPAHSITMYHGEENFYRIQLNDLEENLKDLKKNA
jgi:GNAT superfamily N-acetyltransferase